VGHVILAAVLFIGIIACSCIAPTSKSLPVATGEAEAVSSAAPSALPTDQPTIRPTTLPTIQPTNKPIASPTEALTATPEPTLTQAPTSPPAVAVWEQDITLNTYGWQGALVPTGADDPIYPYPRLNFDAVTPPVPQTYRAVTIQNAYVQLVVVPELGGRILRWTDLTTGRQLFYANPVIKPTRWGYREWWFATGGMEWAFPTDEHGLNEYRPWQYQLLWNGVRVWDTEDRTGMTVEVTIQLEGGRNIFSVTPRISNSTDEAQPYQFWANAMLTVSDGNAPSPNLTFILPDDAVTVHSTGDGGLPGPGGQMTWPVHDGRDLWARTIRATIRASCASFPPLPPRGSRFSAWATCHPASGRTMTAAISRYGAGGHRPFGTIGRWSRARV
jgi:hypothetical protein